MAGELHARAFAKINTMLRVFGRRPDGYHDLATVFRSLALHDTLAFSEEPGPLRVQCDDPSCPADRQNLVWEAAARLWRAGGWRGAPRNLIVRISKRIPLQAGLGGGSSDAAAAVRALSKYWRIDLSAERRHEIAAALGADVPFFLEGGSAVGLGRGDLVLPVADLPPAWVALIVPPFGVSTIEAYEWLDGWRARSKPSGRSHAGQDWQNDLEGPVAARHPEIRRLVGRLRLHGAHSAAMSGSGSAVFGLFERHADALAAARALDQPGRRIVVTRTIGRKAYQSGSRPVRRSR